MSTWDLWMQWLPAQLSGLWASLRVAFVTLGIGLPVGFLLAAAIAGPSRILRVAATVIVEFGRAMPALILLYFLYFGLANIGIALESFTAVVIGLAFSTAAYSSEILRGALQAVPRGEIEAAQALALDRGTIWARILIPQGLRLATPGLAGFSVSMFQTTALAFTVSLHELLATAQSQASLSFRYLEALTLAGILYLCITIPAGLLVSYLEKRMSRHL